MTNRWFERHRITPAKMCRAVTAGPQASTRFWDQKNREKRAVCTRKRPQLSMHVWRLLHLGTVPIFAGTARAPTRSIGRRWSAKMGLSPSTLGHRLFQVVVGASARLALPCDARFDNLL